MMEAVSFEDNIHLLRFHCDVLINSIFHLHSIALFRSLFHECLFSFGLRQCRLLSLIVRSSSQQYGAGSGAQAVSLPIFPKRLLARSKQILRRFTGGINSPMPPGLGW
jgi:hypothetical protein